MDAIRSTRTVAFALLALGMTSVVAARELPRWELGAGTAAFYVPDYRGADEGRAYVLPFPYFVYRGERLRADRDGLRGALIDRNRVELNVSAGLGVPVRSEHNEARRGLRPLDPVVEPGPSLNIILARDAAARSEWQLRLPLRAAYALHDTRAQDVGFVFSPRLRHEWREVGWLGGAALRAAAGPDFGSRRYHGYVFDVPATAATAQRPAFAARGGYSGFSLSLTADRSFGRHRLFAYFGADTVRSAAFADSPLVRRSTGFGAGVAYVYVMATGGRAARGPQHGL